MVVIKIKNLE